VPIVAVGLISLFFALRDLDPKHTVWLFAVVTVLAAIWNVCVPFVVAAKVNWGLLVPPMRPLGSDFLLGLYRPGAAFSSSDSAWPPLTLVIGHAFAWLDTSLAYPAYVASLVLLGLVASAISAKLASKATYTLGRSAGDLPRYLFLAIALWLVTSYGFMFEVERGNANIYALFFSVLAIWTLVRFPQSAWFPAALLAIAINIKVYPAVLLAVLFWRLRWRAIVPVVATNVALLLVAGPANALSFLVNLRSLGGAPFLWAGNHSAVSFVVLLSQQLEMPYRNVRYMLLVPALLIPAVLWIWTISVAARQGRTNRGAVLMAAASMPVMTIFPTVSHDYTLVLLVLPLALTVLLVATMRNLPSSARTALFAASCLELVYLGRSTMLTISPVLANKYPLLVALQVLILVLVIVGDDTAMDPLSHAIAV